MRGVAIVVLCILIAGCATKRYGRLQGVSGVEQAYYTCRDVEMEIAKVEAFREQIASGAQIDWRSAAGFLADFGIGNAMEKTEAERSATQRMSQLVAMRAQRQCGRQTVASTPFTAASSSPNGIALIPADTASGFCVQAPADYMGTGSKGRPVVTSAMPRCPVE